MCVPGSPSGLPDLNWSLCGWSEMVISFTALLCTSDWSSTISNNVWHMSSYLPKDVLSTCVSSSIMFDNILKWLTSFSFFSLPSHNYVSLSSGTWITSCKYAFSLRSGAWSDLEGCLQPSANPPRFVLQRVSVTWWGKEFNDAS